MTKDFLAEMYKQSKQRVCTLTAAKDEDLPIRSLREALRPLSIIAEVKYATPADGPLGITEKPGNLARMYAELGARAISCLTEPTYFKGDLEYISHIRKKCDLPILMKDFIVDERQILAGRARGADAFLLITEMLNPEELGRLYGFGKELGMDILVEVHGPEGLQKALAIGADIIGVNCRNLASLKVDPSVHDQMAALLPTDAKHVAESGITTGARLGELKTLGYDGALIGRAMALDDFRRDIFACG